MTADNKEMLRLGSIVQQFNEAVAGYIEQEPVVSEQLQTILEKNPELEEELAERAMDLIGAAFEAGDEDDEEHNAVTAACAIAFLNSFLVLFQKAGLENDVAQFFPKGERTQANADAFNGVNAPNVARLCL